MKKLIIPLLALMIPLQTHAGTMSSMGQCKITFYCSCSECSGPYGDLTATGTRCEEGRTVAVDPGVIDIGSKVLINGIVYTAEDTGGGVKGDHIDIYLDDHDLTDKLGVSYTDVWIVKGGEWDE